MASKRKRRQTGEASALGGVSRAGASPAFSEPVMRLMGPTRHREGTAGEKGPGVSCSGLERQTRGTSIRFDQRFVDLGLKSFFSTIDTRSHVLRRWPQQISQAHDYIVRSIIG